MEAPQILLLGIALIFAANSQAGNFANSEAENRGNETGSLIPKIVSVLLRKPTAEAVEAAQARKEEPKQVLGGKLPPFLERIVQRIQNYFSTYNPPQFFERPTTKPQIQGLDQEDSQASSDLIFCLDSKNRTVPCRLTEDEEDEPIEENCELPADDGNGNKIGSQDSDEIVSSQTVVQDNSVHVYADPHQNNAPVIIILEEPNPSGIEERPPTPEKFYVHASTNVGTFQPSDSPSYSVYTNKNGLNEYVNNMGLDHNVAIYVAKASRRRQKCAQMPISLNGTENEIEETANVTVNDGNVANVTVSSDGSGKVAEDMANVTVPSDESGKAISSADLDDDSVPNLNLVLLPQNRPKDCGQNNDNSNNNNNSNKPVKIEYYILRPESSEITAALSHARNKTYHLQKLTNSYLPPPTDEDKIEGKC